MLRPVEFEKEERSTWKHFHFFMNMAVLLDGIKFVVHRLFCDCYCLGSIQTPKLVHIRVETFSNCTVLRAFTNLDSYFIRAEAFTRSID